MSYINYTAKEVNVKVVYYGASLSGKTTNLQYIYDRTTPDVRSAITTVNLQTDKMLSFNFLPLALGEINGFKVRFHLYTLSGQVFYASSSKTVLKGLDGVCFIGDSQIERMEANLESLKSLNSNLMEMGLDPIKFPRVVQYNSERFVGACCDARSPAGPPTKRGVGQARRGVRGARCAESRKMLMRISLRPAWSMELVAYAFWCDESHNGGLAGQAGVPSRQARSAMRYGSSSRAYGSSTQCRIQATRIPRAR